MSNKPELPNLSFSKRLAFPEHATALAEYSYCLEGRVPSLHMTGIPCTTQNAAIPVHLPVHFQRQCLQMCNFLKDKKRRNSFSIMRSHNSSIQYPNSISFQRSPHSGENLPSEFLHLPALKHNFALSLLASLVSGKKKINKNCKTSFFARFSPHPQHFKSLISQNSAFELHK